MRRYFYLLLAFWVVSLHGMKNDEESLAPLFYCNKSSSLPSPQSIANTFKTTPGIGNYASLLSTLKPCIPFSGRLFELAAAYTLQKQEAILGFGFDLHITSPKIRLSTEFDIITQKHIVECKRVNHFRKRARDQIEKQLKILGLLRKICSLFSKSDLVVDTSGKCTKIKIGEFTICSAWLHTFMAECSIESWKLILTSLAKKSFSLCSTAQPETDKKLRNFLKNHQEVNFIQMEIAVH